MGLPEPTQLSEDRLRQRNPAFLVALAGDVDEASDPIDRRDFERRRFADAQTACIHQQEARFEGGLPYAANDRSRLGVRQDDRQPSVLWRFDSFFENNGQSRSSVQAKKNWMPP